MRAARRPRAVPAVVLPDVGDSATSRAVDMVAALAADGFRPVVVERDLVVGVNKLSHGLGRPPQFVAVAPSVADATFAWAWTSPTRPALELWLTVVGVAQPGARITYW